MYILIDFLEILFVSICFQIFSVFFGKKFIIFDSVTCVCLCFSCVCMIFLDVLNDIRLIFLGRWQKGEEVVCTCLDIRFVHFFCFLKTSILQSTSSRLWSIWKCGKIAIFSYFQSKIIQFWKLLTPSSWYKPTDKGFKQATLLLDSENKLKGRESTVYN